MKVLDIHPDIQKALQHKEAVVALESTILSHGMPYPENIQMANKVESIIKELGAIPATIAIINGVIKIGLTKEEVDHLGKSKDVWKVSKRDIPYVCSKQLTGATTVSATMILAAMAGISVFATGGIGGVHRGASDTWDVSRDLEELASVNVCVVSSGAKAILDLPKTLEYLETKGVEVIGYQTDAFPAFYSRNSGLKAPLRLDNAEEIASLLATKWTLGLSGGVVVANPIPKDHEIASDAMNEAINEAQAEAVRLGINGKELTPFLLARLNETTSGVSLKANLALVYHNAEVAANIAVAYQNLIRRNSK